MATAPSWPRRRRWPLLVVAVLAFVGNAAALADAEQGGHAQTRRRRLVPLMPDSANPKPQPTTAGRPPAPTLPDYDELMAKTLVDFCAAAYACGSYQGCGQWACTSCQLHPNTEVIRFQDEATGANSGFVGYDPDAKRVVLAYAGTPVADVQAWMNNINGELVAYPKCENCQVHRGFYDDYRSTSKAMKEALGYVLSKFPQAPIWVTGHSLGGALAMLAVTDLHSNHSLATAGIYTFGQPRVGNQAFAMHFKEITAGAGTPYYRVVHAQDPVVHVPPVLLGFWHAPTEVFYNEEQTSYQLCDATGEDFYCSNNYLFEFNIQDHTNYLGTPL